MDLLTLANNVARRVEAQATQAKVPVAVCVVDVHGNVVDGIIASNYGDRA